jgi:hypothetical protein
MEVPQLLVQILLKLATHGLLVRFQQNDDGRNTTGPVYIEVDVHNRIDVVSISDVRKIIGPELSGKFIINTLDIDVFAIREYIIEKENRLNI